MIVLTKEKVIQLGTRGIFGRLRERTHAKTGIARCRAADSIVFVSFLVEGVPDIFGNVKGVLRDSDQQGCMG